MLSDMRGRSATESQMRLHLAVPAVLAACFIASVAVAENDRVSATFDSFAASGVSGTAMLNPEPNGVAIHATLKGLQPGVEYVALVYNQSTTCGEGTSSFTIVRFQANTAGVATWNEKVAKTLPEIESIAIRDVGTSALVACATVPQ